MTTSNHVAYGKNSCNGFVPSLRQDKVATSSHVTFRKNSINGPVPSQRQDTNMVVNFFAKPELSKCMEDLCGKDPVQNPSISPLTPSNGIRKGSVVSFEVPIPINGPVPPLSPDTLADVLAQPQVPRFVDGFHRKDPDRDTSISPLIPCNGIGNDSVVSVKVPIPDEEKNPSAYSSFSSQKVRGLTYSCVGVLSKCVIHHFIFRLLIFAISNHFMIDIAIKLLIG